MIYMYVLSETLWSKSCALNILSCSRTAQINYLLLMTYIQKKIRSQNIKIKGSVLSYSKQETTHGIV